MRHLTLIVLVVFLNSYNCERNVDINYKVKVYEKIIAKRRWKKAEKVLDDLINNDSLENLEEYYINMIDVLNEERKEIIFSYKMSNPPLSENYPKSSIITTISKNYGPEADRILNKQVTVIKKYFKKFPNGRFSIDLKFSLLNAYHSLGNEKEALKIAHEFFKSNNVKDKLGGANILALYSQANEQYNEAIKYLKFIVDNENELIKKIEHIYYIAVCYYELDKIEESRKYLKKVFELSVDSTNKIMVRYAKIMSDFLDEYEANPRKEKRQFVFFKKRER